MLYTKIVKKDFMFNYRVENLHELLKSLREEGVTIIDKVKEFEYGKFGWILDNDGNIDIESGSINFGKHGDYDNLKYINKIHK